MASAGAHEEWLGVIPDGCPPSDALPPRGELIRMVKFNPPQAWDFESPLERDPTRDFGSKKCLAAGLSVIARSEEVAAFRRQVPVMRKRMAAVGRVDGQGVSKVTRGPVPSHVTWWRPAGTNVGPALQYRQACELVARDVGARTLAARRNVRVLRWPSPLHLSITNGPAVHSCLGRRR